MLLIDELLNAPIIDNVEKTKLAGVQSWLQQARKFELGPDFAAAADELASSLQTIAQALPYCRLPFPHTWIEVAQQHRPRFAAAPIHVPEFQHLPKRIGFMLQQMPDDTFEAYQFWSLVKTPIPQASFLGMTFMPKLAERVSPDVGPPQEQHQYHILRDVGPSEAWEKASNYVRSVLMEVCIPAALPYIDNDLMYGHPGFSQLSLELGAADWAGEVNFVLAVLCLLNTVNATETVQVSQKKLNKARAKQRKPPLSDHGVLVIAPRLKRHIVGGSTGNGGHRELRAHLCRGHFKVRKTGIFFWRPHARGSKGTPQDRRYRVE